MIHRYQTNHLLELLQESPAIAITGARQTGKTTLAKSFNQHLSSACHYLDLEYPTDLAKLQDPVLYLEQYQEDCIILDEVHRMPELFPVLRSLIDRNRRPGRFILLGSASPDLLRDSSESLAGRIAYTELHPFQLLEVENQTDWKTLLMRGGFPESLLATSLKSSMRWRTHFIKTWLERELNILGLTSDPLVMRKLLMMIANAQGQILNMQNLANALGVSRPTISRYIDYLEKTYMLFRLEPYYANLKKRLVKSPKLYIADSGIFHSMMGIHDFEALINHPGVGPSWEGAVINQTRAVLPEDHQLWFFRTQDGAEADILITRQDQPVISAEIKWTNSPSVAKGFRNVISYLETRQNFLITPEADTYPVTENIKVTSLREWLRFVSNSLSDL